MAIGICTSDPHLHQAVEAGAAKAEVEKQVDTLKVNNARLTAEIQRQALEMQKQQDAFAKAQEEIKRVTVRDPLAHIYFSPFSDN